MWVHAWPLTRANDIESKGPHIQITVRAGRGCGALRSCWMGMGTRHSGDWRGLSRRRRRLWGEQERMLAPCRPSGFRFQATRNPLVHLLGASNSRECSGENALKNPLSAHTTPPQPPPQVHETPFSYKGPAQRSKQIIFLPSRLFLREEESLNASCDNPQSWTLGENEMWHRRKKLKRTI